ncbi:WD repeat-containing protein 13-like [Eriocheir sinensis]|uniref:WD repeat-containing protein 13-like n=1 Tax=Eriocheir sinensis TaxID=95602 RepID=UPI0021C5C412|nr:WD repeat-containing protein 13-like [Eriocheir sinensis]
MAWWQQVLAVDAKFNYHRAPVSPGFKTLYIRRRNQLLRDSAREDGAAVRNYLKIRLALLQQRYCVTLDQLSLKSRTTSLRSGSRLTIEGDSPHMSRSMSMALAQPGSQSVEGPHGLPPVGSVIPTQRAEASRAIVGGTSIGENYAFSGMHHIFDQHKESVTMVRFAHNDPGLLACCSLDGTLSICQVADGEPRVLHTLRKHSAGVTGFDWSATNDLLLSCGLDGNVCLWRVSLGECLRSVTDQAGSLVLSCVFHPFNANWVVLGNSRGMVQVLNMSTGHYPKGGTSKVAGQVTSLTFDSAGKTLWAGDDKGIIISFLFDLGSGCLRKGKRCVVSEGASITSLSARTWASREAPNPTLLVSAGCNALLLYRVVDKEGGLRLRRKFTIPHKSEPVRSTFCPLMSFRQGACVVSGCEDCSVWFLDVERDTRPLINRLQGHAAPVLGVTFNYDESLLATSDASGLVILWKRE